MKASVALQFVLFDQPIGKTKLYSAVNCQMGILKQIFQYTVNPSLSFLNQGIPNLWNWNVVSDGGGKHKTARVILECAKWSRG